MCKFKNTRINVKCPQCGYNNLIPFEYSNPNNLEVIYCNLDEGGCDMLFGYQVEVQSTVQLYTLNKVQREDRNWRKETLQSALSAKEKNELKLDPSLCDICGSEWSQCQCIGG